MGLSSYRSLLLDGGAWRFSLAGWVARLYRVGSVVGVVLLLTATGTDFALAGIASAAVIVGAAIGGPAWARLADRAGQRVALPLAALAPVLATGGFVLASTQAPLVWLPAAVAMGLATADPGGFVRARWMHLLPDRDRRHTALALESANDEMGFLLGLPVVALVAAWSPVGGLLGAAGAGAIGLLALRALGASIPPVTRSGSRADRARDLGRDWRAWLPVGVAPTLPAFLGVGSVFGFVNLSGIAVADAAGVPEVSGVVIGVLSLGAVAAGLLWGAFGSRVPPAWRLVVATGLFAALVPLLGVGHDPLTYGVLAAIAGAGLTPLMIATTAAIEERTPVATLTVALTWPAVAMSAGSAIGSTLAGATIESAGVTGTWWIPLVSVALALVSLVLAAVTRRDSIGAPVYARR